MPLDLTPFTSAVHRLREGLRRYEQDTSDEQIRDGLIQRFEFTYELSHKMLRRYLEQASADPQEFRSMTFAALVRTGNDMGLLRGEWPAWKKFREMRARSSHTYDEKVAREVAEIIPSFLEEAEYLLDALSRRPL